MKTDKIAISAAFLFFVVGVCFGKIQPSGEIMSLQNNIREIAKTVNPAVVFIETSKAVTASDKKNNQQYGFPGYRWFFRDEDNEDDQEWQMDRGRKKDNNENDNNRIRPRMPQYQMPRGIGSGMIFKKEGYILTNYHVVEDSSEIKVTLFENNKKYTAELAGYDKRHDVAVIKIKESRDFPFVSLGNSDNTRIGDFVIALGNPFGYSNTVTMGIVSFKGRMFENVEITGIPKRIPNIIQTDAAINPGNSGGPLVDVSGEVIGVNVAIAGNFGFGAAGNQGIGFAIPINDVKRILDGLVLGKKNDSETPWIGVRLQDVDEKLAKKLGTKSGVIITEADEKGPGKAAGLKGGDVMVKFEGKDVNSAQQLISMVAEKEAGDEVELTLMRDGKELKIKVTLASWGKKDSSEKRSAAKSKSNNVLGMNVSSINDKNRNYFQLKKDKGVVITGIESDGLADKAGLMEGDVIIKIDKKQIDSIEEYEEMISKADPKDGVLFLIERQGTPVFVVVTSEK